MKKILFIALALVTSAFFTTAVAGDKNKKKQKQQDKVVVLKNASDTVSYAAGKNHRAKYVAQFERPKHAARKAVYG